MNAPRVSVLIGCWNNAATLPAAIDSILAQTVAALELIVVDDGSTDETPALVRAIGDSRVRYLPLDHMGIARSLNAGLRAARAPVVAVQDADDWSEPARLERQLAVFDERPDVVVVGVRMREVDESGRELAPRTGQSAGDVTRALLRHNPIPNSAASFRRDVVLALGGYDARYRYAMDYDLWLRAAERGRVVVLPDRLATRRMSSRNVAATRERAQTAEVVRMRVRAQVRRRTLRGSGAIVAPVLSYLAPLPLKRAIRRRRGQAP
jgi:glycosyltransferase involved in cell wall biosynthesis